MIFLYYFWASHNTYYTIADDSIIEWLQFFILLISSILCFIKSGTERKLTNLYLKLSGFLMLILAAEEISWGSRIFKYSVESIKSLNYQSEVNFHNILPLYGNVSIYIYGCLFIICSSFLIEYFLLRKNLIFCNIKHYLLLSTLMTLYFFLNKYTNVYFYEYSEMIIYTGFLMCLSRYWIIWFLLSAILSQLIISL